MSLVTIGTNNSSGGDLYYYVGVCGSLQSYVGNPTTDTSINVDLNDYGWTSGEYCYEIFDTVSGCQCSGSAIASTPTPTPTNTQTPTPTPTNTQTPTSTSSNILYEVSGCCDSGTFVIEITDGVTLSLGQTYNYGLGNILGNTCITPIQEVVSGTIVASFQSTALSTVTNCFDTKCTDICSGRYTLLNCDGVTQFVYQIENMPLAALGQTFYDALDILPGPQSCWQISGPASSSSSGTLNYTTQISPYVQPNCSTGPCGGTP